MVGDATDDNTDDDAAPDTGLHVPVAVGGSGSGDMAATPDGSSSGNELGGSIKRASS